LRRSRLPRPNEHGDAAHRALVDLERAFDVRIVTQNVDDLHERAGSTHVLHLHGEIMLARSTRDPGLIRHLGDADISVGLLDKPHGAAIPLQLLVCSQQDEAFRLCLRNQHPIERILVEIRQPIDGDGMRTGESKFGIAVLEQSAPQLPGIDSEISSAKRSLDGDFPKADNTEVNRIPTVHKHALGGSGKPFRLSGGPQQYVCVEKEVHAPSSCPKRVSMTSFPKVSKSSGTEI
jgi:hypothetical protein